MIFKKRTKKVISGGRKRHSSGVTETEARRNLFRRGSSLNTMRLHHVAVREQKLEQSRRHHQERSVAIWAIAIILIVVGVAYLAVTRITSVEVVGFSDNRQITISDTDNYKVSINKVLASSFMGNLQPFIPVDEISKELMADYPEIQAVAIHNNGLTRKLVVQLEFRRPVMVWQTKSNQQFFLSSDGTAFQINHSDIDSGKLIHLVDSSGLGAEAGKTLTSAQMIDFLLALHKTLGKAGIDVDGYSLPKSLREIDVKLAGKPYIVKFLSTNDVGQEVAQLKQSLDFFTKHPDQAPSKYLDLRVIGRGFYQ